MIDLLKRVFQLKVYWHYKQWHIWVSFFPCSQLVSKWNYPLSYVREKQVSSEMVNILSSQLHNFQPLSGTNQLMLKIILMISILAELPQLLSLHLQRDNDFKPALLSVINVWIDKTFTSKSHFQFLSVLSTREQGLQFVE